MAITTIYKGIEYRSRLEARWAAFFNRLDWHYTYEPFDGDGYIPDFLIHGQSPLLVEVKPAATLEEYAAPIDKATRGLADHWHNDILIVGITPFPQLGSAWGDGMRALGLLGEYAYDGRWDFNLGLWTRCTNCGANAVYHETSTFACRPCGCYDGDHYLSYPQFDILTDAWADACNDVKWQGRAA